MKSAYRCGTGSGGIGCSAVRGGGGGGGGGRGAGGGGRDGGKEGGKRFFFRRRKVCKFCADKIDYVDYKDVMTLRKFVSERGKIRARRVSGGSAFQPSRHAVLRLRPSKDHASARSFAEVSGWLITRRSASSERGRSPDRW